MTDSSVTGRNQNHSDVRDESARDNDPLFELSRIFGFEEPANQTAVQNSQDETEFSSEISLERELMADFDAEFATEFAAQPSGETFAGEFAEPDNNQSSHQYLQNDRQDYAPQVPAESRHAEPVVEPHFTGYAPLQRAYAENKIAPDNASIEQAQTSGHEEPHYYAHNAPEPHFEPVAASDAYYGAYSASEQTGNYDNFSSMEDALSQNFAPVDAAHASTEQDFDLPDLNFNDLGFDEIGREPHQEFVAQSFDNSDDVNNTLNVEQPQVQQIAALSFEDELAFLLHDQTPNQGPAVAAYSQPAPVQPAAFDEPVVAETDFAPLFDAPANEFSPVASTYDEQEDAAHDYSNPEPVHNYAPVEDEFFAAPDLTHLPNRTSSAYTYTEEESVEEEIPVAEHSFADLFGASSQPSFEPEPESFGLGDDFYGAEPSKSVEEPAAVPSLTHPAVVRPVSHPAAVRPVSHPAALPPVSHNAVRGYSNYTFGAATPATGVVNHGLNDHTSVETPITYASITEPESAAVAGFGDNGSEYEETAGASEDFFNNDDFDFSFEEDVQTADNYPAAAVEEEPELPAYQPPFTISSKTFAPAPEIEAIAVSENKVEQTQLLDLPDVSFVDEAKATGLNNLESEFAEIFSTISVTEPAMPDTTSEADKAFENILQDNFADYHASVKDDAAQAAGLAAAIASASVGAAARANAGANTGAGAETRGYSPQASSADPSAKNATQDDYYNHWAAQGAQANDFETYNLGDDFARDDEEFEEYRPREENPLRKPILWASVAAAALIVLGGGYYALKSGGVVGGEPVVLRADNQPVKMQPENPGGTVVPNQDKAVYDQVSGNKPTAPEQKTLINTEEEPVDVGLLQGQDAEEDRLSDEQVDNTTSTPPAATVNPQEAQQGLIAPRTVKTMVVRADGTIVQGDAPAANPEPAPTDSGLDEASRLISQSAVPERLGGDKPAVSAQSAAAPRVVQTQTFTASGEQVKPREVTTAPVVPSRPAEQPVNVVGQVERPAQSQTQTQAQATQQMASANVTSANVPAGTWFVQVASQPSAELAQKNYANLTSRYGNLIGGRGVDIKKADIPGKGTYYRVRIPGGTKAEAAALCERLKSAGGSCFPTL